MVVSAISIENIFSSLSFNFVYNFFAINLKKYIYVKKHTCLITRIFGLFGGFFLFQIYSPKYHSNSLLFSNIKPLLFLFIV